MEEGNLFERVLMKTMAGYAKEMTERHKGTVRHPLKITNCGSGPGDLCYCSVMEWQEPDDVSF